ncbi:hypothetical protein GCM10009597_13140 [Peribacillus frigoritolerans]
MGKRVDKTNVLRILDKKKIMYNYYSYDSTKLNFIDVNNSLGQDLATVFKTLVLWGNLKSVMSLWCQWKTSLI